jgi:superfamily II DNA or RNA helicase
MTCRNIVNDKACLGPCYWQDGACNYKCSGNASFVITPRDDCVRSNTNDGYCCILQPEDVLIYLSAIRTIVQRDQTAVVAIALMETTLQEALQDATPETRDIVVGMGRDFLEQAQVRATRVVTAAPQWLADRQLAVMRAAPARSAAEERIASAQRMASATSASSDAEPRSFSLGLAEDAINVVTQLREVPTPAFVPPTGSLDNVTAIRQSRLAPGEYQVVAARHILNHRGLIVAHEVGLGKTLTAILAAELLLQNNLVDKVIVVTPSFLITNFHDALRRDYGINDTSRYKLFSHRQFYAQYSKYINTTLPDESSLDDNQDDAIETLLAEASIATPSRLQIYMKELTRRLTGDMARVCLIIDEAHAFRTTMDLVGEGKGRMAFIMMQAARFASRVLCMTATPMCNVPADICNLVAMVRGDAWPKTTEFNSMLDSYQNEAAINAGRADTRMLTFMQAYCANVFSFARIIKEPPNTLLYPIVKEEDLVIQLQGQAASLLRKVRAKETEALGQLRLPANPFPFSAGLRQAMNSLYETSENEQQGFSLKALAIANVIDPIKNTPAGRTIIFTQWLRNGVTRIEAVLRSKDIQFVSITGQTPKGMRSINKRLFDQQQVQVLILSAAASEGLSFKNVRHVFLMEKAWNTAREQQAVGRATRLYSHRGLPNEADRQVTVYHVMMTERDYETTDVRMRALAQQKDKVIAIVQRLLDNISIPTPNATMTSLIPPQPKGPIIPTRQISNASGIRIENDAFASRRIIMPPAPSTPRDRAPGPVGGSVVPRMGTARPINTSAIAAALSSNRPGSITPTPRR